MGSTTLSTRGFQQLKRVARRSKNEVENLLNQDLRGLRSRKGDTIERPEFYLREGLMTGVVCDKRWVMESGAYHLPRVVGP